MKPHIDRLPPHDAEAEKGAIGCVLVSANECLGVCVERLKSGPETFYDLRHQTIYRQFLAMWEAKQPIDVLTVRSSLIDAGRLEDAGGYEYLSEAAEVPSAANLPAYLQIIEEKYLLRRIIHTCTGAVASVYESEQEPFDLLDTVERDILAIRPSQHQSSPPIKELAKQAINSLERLYELKGATRGIPTGVTDLDKMTSGLVCGEVYIVAGYPGSGKTSFAMNLAERSILTEKCSVAVFSLEMSSVSLVSRFICSHSKVSMSNVRHGVLCDNDFKSLTVTAGKLSVSSIYFEDDSDVTIYQLRAKARRLHQQHKLQLIVIDYLQLIGASGGPRKMENRQQEVADISRGVKAISRELNVPVIALSQLNDDGKLRESRAIGQDADNVWILDAEKTPANELIVPTKLKIIKARNGPVGHVDLLFFKAFTRFESVAKVERSDVPEKTNQPHND